MPTTSKEVRATMSGFGSRRRGLQNDPKSASRFFFAPSRLACLQNGRFDGHMPPRRLRALRHRASAAAAAPPTPPASTPTVAWQEHRPFALSFTMHCAICVQEKQDGSPHVRIPTSAIHKGHEPSSFGCSPPFLSCEIRWFPLHSLPGGESKRGDPTHC